MAQLAADGPATTGTETRIGASLVDWGAVIAGALLAAALSFVLLTFGTAIGLSSTSPWPNSGLPASVIASLAVFWVLAQQIGSFLAGGYVAGRLRSRWRGSSPDETEFRDGLHGGLVWALGIVLGAALAMAAGSQLVKAGVEAGGRAAASAAATADPTELALDALLRPAGSAAASGRADAASAGSRAEIARLLASSVASGGLSDQNRTYLAQRVSQLTGLSQPDAEGRINEAVTATRRAADKVRRAAVVAGFVTAASLLLSLGAAWWAAVKGGQHRDDAVPPRFGFGRRQRRTVAGT